MRAAKSDAANRRKPSQGLAIGIFESPWSGNIQPIAAKHYLQVTHGHFRSAVEDATMEVVSGLKV